MFAAVALIMRPVRELRILLVTGRVRSMRKRFCAVFRIQLRVRGFHILPRNCSDGVIICEAGMKNSVRFGLDLRIGMAIVSFSFREFKKNLVVRDSTSCRQARIEIFSEISGGYSKS
jgi:hypothetical protein